MHGTLQAGEILISQTTRNVFVKFEVLLSGAKASSMGYQPTPQVGTMPHEALRMKAWHQEGRANFLCRHPDIMNYPGRIVPYHLGLCYPWSDSQQTEISICLAIL
eukprot:80828-Pelagomonas_calceolata.AAC.1